MLTYPPQDRNIAGSTIFLICSLVIIIGGRDNKVLGRPKLIYTGSKHSTRTDFKGFSTQTVPVISFKIFDVINHTHTNKPTTWTGNIYPEICLRDSGRMSERVDIFPSKMIKRVVKSCECVHIRLFYINVWWAESYGIWWHSLEYKSSSSAYLSSRICGYIKPTLTFLWLE